LAPLLYGLYIGLSVRTVYRCTALYICRQTSNYGLTLVGHTARHSHWFQTPHHVPANTQKPSASKASL